MLNPIFATIYDTEKPIYVTLNRALQNDETLRLYVFDNDGTRIPFNEQNGIYHWNELYRGSQFPWPVIPTGTKVILFLDCEELYEVTGSTGAYFLNVGIWDETNAELEITNSELLVLQSALYPGL
jgi:hypothetical protein